MRIYGCHLVLQLLAANKSYNSVEDELCITRGRACIAFQHRLLLCLGEEVLHGSCYRFWRLAALKDRHVKE